MKQISLSPVEMAYLAALMGADSLVGFPDPFFGWLAEEVEGALARARQSLTERGFLRTGSGGATEVTPDVIGLIRPCAFPQACLLATYTPVSGEPRTWHLYLGGEWAVERKLSHGRIELSALEAGEAVEERALQFAGVDGFPSAAAPGMALPVSTLTSARRAAAAEGAEAAGKLLTAAGASPEAAAALAETIAEPVFNSTVVALIYRDHVWETEGIAFLAGAKGLWRMRSFLRAAQEWADIAPSTGTEAAEAVRRIVGRVKLSEGSSEHQREGQR